MPGPHTQPPLAIALSRSAPFQTACVVLAAGAGTRFGEPKAGARLPSGVRFVDAVVESARSAAADPIVVVAPAGLDLPTDVILVTNPDARGEQINSLRLGLARLTNVPVTGALVWPVDHPYVALASVQAILEVARTTGAPIVLPVSGGKRGHPVYFSRSTWRQLATVKDGGARSVVHAYAIALQEVPVIDTGVVRDIDKRSDMTNGEGSIPDAVS
jgi:CTP:molybdopterin cytidylyltransferase MocA